MTKPAPEVALNAETVAEPTDTPTHVTVYVIRTGRKQDVPAHYMSDPVLSLPFRKTPLTPEQQRAADAFLAAANPDETPAAGAKEN